MQSKQWLVFGLVVTLLAIPMLRETSAKKRAPKSTVSVKLGRKRFKSHVVVGAYGSAAVSVGASKAPHRIGGLIQALGFTCVVDHLKTRTFPVTVSCGGDYSEQKLGNPTAKRWDTTTGIQVTFQSIVGLRVTGILSGTFETPDASHASDPPVTAQKGKFVALLTDTGT